LFDCTIVRFGRDSASPVYPALQKLSVDVPSRLYLGTLNRFHAPAFFLVNSSHTYGSLVLIVLTFVVLVGFGIWAS